MWPGACRSAVKWLLDKYGRPERIKKPSVTSMLLVSHSSKQLYYRYGLCIGINFTILIYSLPCPTLKSNLSQYMRVGRYFQTIPAIPISNHWNDLFTIETFTCLWDLCTHKSRSGSRDFEKRGSKVVKRKRGFQSITYSFFSLKWVRNKQIFSKKKAKVTQRADTINELRISTESNNLHTFAGKFRKLGKYQPLIQYGLLVLL